MMPSPTIFDTIRSACARVADAARHIDIDDEQLRRFAAELPVERLQQPGMDEEHHLVGRGDHTVAFVLTLDAVNFGSGYFPHLRPVDGRTGYFMVARALRDRFEEHGPFPARKLAELSALECAELFGQSLQEEQPRELMEHFATALADLGRLLLERFDGRYTTLVGGADHRADRLVEILSEMPLYRDVATYDDFDVPLYKRAQITVADLHLALGGRGLGHFEDLDRLTIFADNQVPHVLRTEGILHYAPPLAKTIDAGRPLAPNSAEEVEIRACGLHAVERMVDHLRQGGVDTTAMAVDNYLWDIGESPPYTEGPKHRTKTVYY